MNAMKRDEQIAREFWQGTGLAERFPREIETAIALKLPLTLVKLPQITTPAVRLWLNSRKPPFPHQCAAPATRDTWRARGH